MGIYVRANVYRNLRGIRVGDSAIHKNWRQSNKSEIMLEKKSADRSLYHRQRNASPIFKMILWKRNRVLTRLGTSVTYCTYLLAIPQSLIPSYAVPLAAGCFGGLLLNQENTIACSLWPPRHWTIPGTTASSFQKCHKVIPIVRARLREDVNIRGTVVSIHFSQACFSRPFGKPLSIAGSA